MTDRELLEAAARAAGIKAVRDPNGVWRNCTGLAPAFNIFCAPAWNPRTDDGDALRLAVKLLLEIDIGHTGVAVRTPNGIKVLVSADEEPNIGAATRLAILKAAAAMGAA